VQTPIIPGLTQSFAKWNAGDLSVEPELMQTIYPILRALAQDELSNNSRVTMQATELAHEAFIKLRSGDYAVENKFQFMGFMAHMLRNLIVDHLRQRGRMKRGGRVQFVRFEEAKLEDADPNEYDFKDVDWIALDAALSKLEQQEPNYARLVELRYFLGYGIEQSALQLGVSTATANRMWRFSRAFLSEEMRT
jgi:RNA polymerase sigma factor (TIGR02999 family)